MRTCFFKLHKLEYYDIRGVPLEWFSSYLNERSQRIYVGGELSNDLGIVGDQVKSSLE